MPSASDTATESPKGRTATASLSSPDDEAVAIARRFDEQRALGDVRMLADPVFMGRHVGTPGELKGAQFLTDTFRRAGLEAGGDGGSFLQPFQLKVQEMASPPVLQLTGPMGETRALRFRDDFRPIFGGSGGPGDVQGPGLFVGSGDDLSSVDTAGKVLMVTLRGPARGVIARAREGGAIGIIITTGTDTLLKGEGGPPDAGAIPVAEVSQSGAAALLESSGHTREELNDDIRAGRPLPTFPLSWTLRLAVFLRPPEDVEAHNVIGVMRASVATERTIVIGAHFEEIGPDPDGVVYPAANDNASGTAVLLELVRLLTESEFRPGTNIVFVGWSGHEEGLFGSSFYVNHPRFPLNQTSLYLNVDTVGQGSSPNLDAVSSEMSSRELLGRALRLLADRGETAPVQPSDKPEGVSDDRNFASAGVPSLSMLWGGLFDDGRIHTPADTAETVDASKLRVTGEVAALIVLLASR